MDRSLVSVLAGTITVILFTLLAGIDLIPLSIRTWLIPLGFILSCLLIGVVGQLRVLHLLLITFIIYLGLMLFLAINATFLVGISFPPLYLEKIWEAWDGFQVFVNSSVPFLVILSDLAAILRALTGGTSLMAVFLEFLVSSLFIGVIGLLITGIGGYITRKPGLYVATAPEPSVEATVFSEPTTQVPIAVDSQASPQSYPPPLPPPTMEAPPPMPAPRPVEEVPPPPPPSKGGSPSAKAIASLKGKVTKHLKGTGQKVPAGQSRCPHCNATVIQGSRFCNACGKDF
jgi:hypothetical protein